VTSCKPRLTSCQSSTSTHSDRIQRGKAGTACAEREKRYSHGCFHSNRRPAFAPQDSLRPIRLRCADARQSSSDCRSAVDRAILNPDALRVNDEAVDFVGDFFKQHKPVAAICHGPWTLIEAGAVEGRRMTSWPSLKTDLINAGATWLDEECVCDQGLLPSRCPDDLPAFCEKAIEEIAEGKHAEQNV